MKMKKYFLYIAATAMLALACQKIDKTPAKSETDPSTPAVEMISETVSGSRAVATKATISDADASFAWTAGDNVAVHISNGEYVYTSDEGAAGATIGDSEDVASFTVVYEKGYERDAFALYPSTIVAKDAANYGQEGHSLDVTLPGSYTLAELSGETSPCPMIASNLSGEGWDFYQLCGLLRLKVNGVPASAKRLEIKFDGKKVCGDFSIANPEPGSSAIESADDAANDCITVTQNGTNVALGEENPVLNIPLPAGVYTKITVIAYDALTDGNALLMAVVPFEYTATNRYGTKKEATLGPVQSIFNFTFTNSETELTGVRFVRVFSAQDKLHNGTSTYGPFTASSDTDLDSPVNAGLYIENEPGDELVFQVVTKDGKVYSGSVVTPADGYEIGETYDVTADVTLYTFTISSGQKVCFSPGDLEINNDVFSFTEPFTTWGAGNTSNTEPTRRVWFDAYKFDLGERAVYGIENWRIPGYVSGAYEWDNIINRTMNDGVAAYYTVTIPGHQYCLLLPPDETISDDIGADLKSGDVTDYVKYLGKGFVLLMNTNRATYTNKWSWGGATYASQGFYWAVRDSRNRYYFTTGNGNPKADFMSSRMRNHIRYVHNVK